MLKRFTVDLDRKVAYDDNGQVVGVVRTVNYSMSSHSPYSSTIAVEVALVDPQQHGWRMQAQTNKTLQEEMDTLLVQTGVVRPEDVRAQLDLPPLENQQEEPERKPTGVREGKPRRFGQ